MAAVCKRYSPYLKIGRELGKFLHEVMGWDGPMTHRQFKVQQEWSSIFDFEPMTLSDYQQMRTAAEVHGLNYILSNDRPSITIDKFQVKFKLKKRPPDPSKMSEAEKQTLLDKMSQESASMWMGMMPGGKVNHHG